MHIMPVKNSHYQLFTKKFYCRITKLNQRFVKRF